ncbi:restriction endonuclease subunit S [Kribbella sp. NPDC051936]|uniref:restriction endonuclease subunit S n=1 Tax=Kribbella sp. NPDC051936 TaxID=3154946 RepID=UPI0034463009
MAPNWIETTLGDVLTLKRGYDLPARERQDGTYPVISSSGLTGRHSAPKVKGPGVVTGRYGTLGEVHYIDEDYWPLNTTLYVQDFKGNDPRFVSYFLKTIDFHAYSDKSSVPGVNRNHLHTARVRFPTDVSEQRAIGELLGSLDAGIASRRAMNVTLQATARALYKSWFVDFDPVKAKAAGASGCPGMPSELFASFPSRLVDTDLGLAPEGWNHEPIGDLVHVVGGGTPSTKNPLYWEAGEFSFCTPKDMSRLIAPVLIETERKLTQAGVDKISSGVLPVGTVLLSSRAPIGYLAIAETPVSVNQGIIAMRARVLPTTYILLWTEANLNRIKSRAGGSTFAEISRRNFNPILALRPDPQVLKTFENMVAPMFQLIASNELACLSLAAVRDALLPKLVTGQLQIPSFINGATK